MQPGNQYILKLPLLIHCMSAMIDKRIRDIAIVYLRIQLILEFLIDVFKTNTCSTTVTHVSRIYSTIQG